MVMSKVETTSARAALRRTGGPEGCRAAVWGLRAAGACSWFGLSLVSYGALADGPGNLEYGHHGMWDGGWGGMLFGWVMMLLVIAAIVAVVVLVVRALGDAGSSNAKSTNRSPMEILEKRFARGEIDAEELEARRSVLGKRSA